MSRFTRGEQVVLREIHDGRIWTARPGIVATDTGDSVAVHIPVGTIWKVPAATSRQEMVERRAEGWRLADYEYRRSPMLWLMPIGESHAVHLWWHGPEWSFGGWYINLQEPSRRRPMGMDFLDQHLDVVIKPEGSWHWKDEDELAQAVQIGLLSDKRAEQLREEATRIVGRFEAGEPPFSDGWEHWRPDPAWAMPEIRDGWDRP